MTRYFTTVVKAQSGRLYDLGLRQYPPKHKDECECGDCLVVDAFPQELPGPR